MSFDGIVTNSIVNELKSALTGGRIDKIYQPEKDELWLYIRNKGENYKLLISAASNNPRIYLTETAKENPQSPPMFCMLLRKHLSGGIILDIEQFKMDRIISINISSLDELGDPSKKTLSIEIMGRHSNIIFVDHEDGKIIDAIKRVTPEMSRVRQVLPDMPYNFPPDQGKLNPLLASKDNFIELIQTEKPETPIFKFFYFNYMGLSPLVSKEICFNANIDRKKKLHELSGEEIDTLFLNFSNIMNKVKAKKFNPMYIKSKEGKVLAFYTLNLYQFEKGEKFYLPTISEVLDIVYEVKDNFDRISQKSQSIKKLVQTKLDRSIKKLSKQKKELKESKDRDKYKVYADVISANIHNIGPGLEKVSLPNFYDENMEKIDIPLNKKISAPQNAQKYYKKYSKLKSRESLLKRQLKETKDEIEYLENVLISIEHSTGIKEIEEIRDELIKENYIRDSRKDRLRRKRKKQDKIKPLHFLSEDGFDIYVGKNNVQNEYVTLKLARKNDLWLHVQGMPGSHVIIKKSNKEIPPRTLEEAGYLAAYYSKAKHSSNVSVDYTEKKHVRKPSGSKTGMVIYDNFQTLNINPSKEKIDKIKSVD